MGPLPRCHLACAGGCKLVLHLPLLHHPLQTHLQRQPGQRGSGSIYAAATQFPHSSVEHQATLRTFNLTHELITRWDGHPQVLAEVRLAAPAGAPGQLQQLPQQQGKQGGEEQQQGREVGGQQQGPDDRPAWRVLRGAGVTGRPPADVAAAAGLPSSWRVVYLAVVFVGAAGVLARISVRLRRRAV